MSPGSSFLHYHKVCARSGSSLLPWSSLDEWSEYRFVSHGATEIRCLTGTYHVWNTRCRPDKYSMNLLTLDKAAKRLAQTRHVPTIVSPCSFPVYLFPFHEIVEEIESS
jgi:hypothetical protein